MANWSACEFNFSGKEENVEKFYNEFLDHVDEDGIFHVEYKGSEYDGDDVIVEYDNESCWGTFRGRWCAPIEWIAEMARKHHLTGDVNDAEPGCDYFITATVTSSGTEINDDDYISELAFSNASEDLAEVIKDDACYRINECDIPEDEKNKYKKVLNNSNLKCN